MLQKLAKSLAFVLALAFLVGCSGQYAPPKPITSNVATLDRLTPSPSSQYDLKVISTIQNDIRGVTFQILSAKTGEVIFAPQVFYRTFDMVIILWGKDDRVWVYSGDVGTTIWEVSNDAREWKAKHYDPQVDTAPEYLKQVRPKFFGQ